MSYLSLVNFNLSVFFYLCHACLIYYLIFVAFNLPVTLGRKLTLRFQNIQNHTYLREWMLSMTHYIKLIFPYMLPLQPSHSYIFHTPRCTYKLIRVDGYPLEPQVSEVKLLPGVNQLLRRINVEPLASLGVSGV